MGRRTSGSHPCFQDFAATYNTVVATNSKKSFPVIWNEMKKAVQTWPPTADEINYNVFDGALLLGEVVTANTGSGADTSTTIQNFIVRCPSYINQFIHSRKAIDARAATLPVPVPAGSSKKVWDKFMSLLAPPIKMSGTIVPPWLLGKASRFNLNRHIMSISGIEDCLQRGAAIDFNGERMTWFHLSIDEFKSVAKHLQKSGEDSGVSLKENEAMDIIRIWHYRANHDQEKPKRPLKRIKLSTVSVASAARGIATLPPSLKLKSLELRRIFGGITAERLRKDLLVTRKKTKSSA